MPESPPDFAIGDLVRFKSGGPTLTVLFVQDGRVRLGGFNATEQYVEVDHLPVEAIEPAKGDLA